jgi:flagellar biosynthesis protein FlhG
MTNPTRVTTTGAAPTPPRPSGRRGDSRVVAVGSGKGGVGTTTVSVLLGSAVAAAGRNVLLVDGSDRLGSLHVIFGIEPLHTLDRLRGTGHEPDSLLVPVAPHLTLLPAPPAGSEDDLTRAERRALERRMTSLYPDFELVIIDAGASADALLAACESASRLLAVTAADRMSLVSTYALVKLLHQRAPNVRVDVVANRVDDVAAARAHEYLNAATVRFLSRTVPFAGVIPDDPDFGSALAAGLGAHDAAHGSTAAASLRDLGERLIAELVDEQTNTTPLRLLRKG